MQNGLFLGPGRAACLFRHPPIPRRTGGCYCEDAGAIAAPRAIEESAPEIGGLMYRSLCRAGACTWFAALVLLFAFSSTPVALAGTGAQITGKTTDLSGAPLPGMEIRARAVNDVVATATSGVDGTYHIDNLPPDTYNVYFMDPAGLHRYQLYPGTIWGSDATFFDLSAGQTLLNIDATMSPCAAISGTITDLLTHAPIPNATVDWEVWNGGGWDYTTGITADVNGHYLLPELGAGIYKLHFWAYGHIGQWSGGGANASSAQTVSVGATQAVVYNAALDPGSSIEGTVTNSAGTPLEGVAVNVLTRGSSGTWSWSESDYTFTDANGHYRSPSMGPGQYKIQFVPVGGSGLLSEYFNSAADIASATTVTLGSHESTTLPVVTLDKGGSIGGTVTDAGSHSAIEGVTAQVFTFEDGDWNTIDSVQTGSDGTYEFGGLPTGSYRVKFSIENRSYAYGYYGGAGTVASATPVPVTKGVKTSGIDAALGQPSAIEGTVTEAATGLPLAGIVVDVWAENASGGWEWVEYGFSASDGSYRLGGLRTGSYHVLFTPQQDRYAREYYADSGARAGSTAVPVGPVAVAKLATTTLEAAGSISGTVRNAFGTAPLPGIAVEVCELVDGRWSGFQNATTDSDGRYSVSRLHAGTYKIVFHDWDHGVLADQWYDRKATDAPAYSVLVQAGAETSGIDAYMGVAGPFTLKYAAGGGGHLSGSASQTVAYGSDGAMVTAVPNSGYRFVRWSDGVTKASRREMSVLAGVTLTAYFGKTTSVSITSRVTSLVHAHKLALSGHVSSNLVSNTHVEVWAKKPGSSTWVKLSTRHSTSSHHWSYSYSPSTKGTWYFQARFTGNSKYAASTSSSRRITVK